MSETSIDLAGLFGADVFSTSAGPYRGVDDQFTLNVIRVLLSRWDELVDVLTAIATRPAAVDELRRSISCLAGASWELGRHQPRRIRELAVFLPSNNILYSYVLFGLIPARYSDAVVIRPSARVADTARAVHRILSTDPLLAGDFPIEFAELSQRQFVRRCAAADAVVFTGQASNAETVAAQLTANPLFLAFGSGPNPVVAGPKADLARVVSDVLRVRTYNSGQDCLCPDVIFAHESVADDLVSGFEQSIRRLNVGARTEHDVDVAPLVYADAVAEIGSFLHHHRAHVRAGGAVSEETGLVQPTLLDLPWDENFHPPEFFGPVFCVVRYRDLAGLRRWAAKPAEARRGMYLSQYGAEDLTGDVFGTSVVLHEQITLDMENGNEPLGGYGFDASHVRRGATVLARPLLLSAELGRDSLIGLAGVS
ncbi:aldehyde dehydrogenase family protein [Amycolatopsis albispora]|uniref:Aldehyde dehydrogenase domain-containing protein n=1 Tax=Amycolatopsis albispora TaxID=1804986 RepID=A0A344L5H4_9PSEU|nr:aldehyde dehydrogenase family protein [Amycolatopsis albispora]AXB43298.1 hypothetical protein A4R43_12650 [Amycolatopsis albispora]